MHKIRMILAAISFAGLVLSCNIINPPEEIPAYIHVDSILVKVTNFEQGSASQNLTCVKINVGGMSLGFFELPTMVPSLRTGLQSLYIEPGFDLNGINGTRYVYPFFKPYTGTEKANLVAGEIYTLSMPTSYKPECKFPWIEDFEDAGVSFLYPAYSDTIFVSQSDQVREGRHSGAIFLNSKNKFFEAFSSSDFDLPDRTKSPMVLLEFDYLNNINLEVGVYVIQNESAIWNSLLLVRPSEHWNRIYIDLQTIVGQNTSADFFTPAFRAAWDSTGLANQSIYLDNLKLIHF